MNRVRIRPITVVLALVAVLLCCGGTARASEPAASYTCCVGYVGNVNGDAGDYATIGDVAHLVDALFISHTCGKIVCLAEADVNQSGGCNPTCADLTIGDIATLIDCSIMLIHRDEPCLALCLVCP